MKGYNGGGTRRGTQPAAPVVPLLTGGSTVWAVVPLVWGGSTASARTLSIRVSGLRWGGSTAALGGGSTAGAVVPLLWGR